MAVINKHISQNSFVLRHSISPYVVMPFILFLATLISVPYIIRTHDLTSLKLFIVGLIIFFPVAYMDSRYRIWWQDGAVIQRAADGSITTIRVDEIERIEQETSDLQTLLSLSRPFRRITIYGSTSEGMKVIDVSLKHFYLEDVRKLIKVIHDRCPDLPMPKNWV